MVVMGTSVVVMVEAIAAVVVTIDNTSRRNRLITFWIYETHMIAMKLFVHIYQLYMPLSICIFPI